MEKERGYKVVAIVALLLAVVGVGIGFAAFSATFTINEETVTVNPSENLLEANMHFTGVINGEASMGYDEWITFKNKGTAEGRVWSGIEIEVTNKQAVPSIFAEIINESNYDAYITNIRTIADENSKVKSDKVVCVAEEGTNQALVDEYCKNVGAEIYLYKGPDQEYNENEVAWATTSSAAALDITTGNKLAPNEKAFILLTMWLGRDSVVTFPDGPFKVYIPSIEFSFSTAKPAQTN